MEGYCLPQGTHQKLAPVTKTDTLPCLNWTCLKYLKIKVPAKCLLIYQMKADGKYIHNIDVKIAYIYHISQNIGIFYLVLMTHYTLVNRNHVHVGGQQWIGCPVQLSGLLFYSLWLPWMLLWHTPAYLKVLNCSLSITLTVFNKIIMNRRPNQLIW